MAWSFADILESLGEQAEGIIDAFTRERQESGISSLVTPIDPFNRSSVLTPLISIAGVISVLLLAGVAVGAMAALLSALMALYYLLTEVFGYDISVAMPEAAS